MSPRSPRTQERRLGGRSRGAGTGALAPAGRRSSVSSGEQISGEDMRQVAKQSGDITDRSGIPGPCASAGDPEHRNGCRNLLRLGVRDIEPHSGCVLSLVTWVESR